MLERMTKALRHVESDCVPVGIGTSLAQNLSFFGNVSENKNVSENLSENNMFDLGRNHKQCDYIYTLAS